MIFGFSPGGPIPAWAGEPAGELSTTEILRAYPRVGGGTPNINGTTPQRSGLSPRGRGNPLLQVPPFFLPGPIPAWAGEPIFRVIDWLSLRAYPRVGGGTSSRSRSTLTGMGLSPRGRGNHGAHGLELCAWGPIPAWAGEPTKSADHSAVSTAYPRVGGGTAKDHKAAREAMGLSPRGRGNHPNLLYALGAAGPIPAWAGEPGK